METAAIVTTRANRTLADIHDRMPVIVPPEAFDLWLDCKNVNAETAAAAVVAPAAEDLLEAYEVSTAVNRAANEGPQLVERHLARADAEPAGPRPRARRAAKAKDDGQGVLF